MTDPVDRAIAAIAARHRGHVSRRQLLNLGLTTNEIAYRLRIGRLHSVFPGVYAVGHVRRAPIDRAAAAVLACGAGAVLSHFSAAALWGFIPRWPRQFEVIVPGDRRPEGIRTHRIKTLMSRDKTRHHDIPVTGPARTVLDCTASLSDERLPRFVNEALTTKYLKEAAFAEVLERYPSHPGTKRLIPYATNKNGRTRSELEDMFVAFIERFGLPRPELNVPMNGRIVDAFFRAEGVIVELDGYEFHRTRAVFERDRKKDVDALVSGLLTVRITEDRLDRIPEEEAARLGQILESRRGRRRHDAR